MRALFLLSLSLALVSSQTAAETPAIEWQSGRPLVWNDFLGSVPLLADSRRAATSGTSIAWSYRYTIERRGNACRYRIAEIDSTAAFHPDDSWVRPEARTDEILQHEQLHFDITRLFQQRFASATLSHVGMERPCSGRNDRQATRFVEDEISDLIGSTYESAWREHLATQAAYDEETQHGIDRTAQAEWTDEIAARLANPSH